MSFASHVFASLHNRVSGQGSASDRLRWSYVPLRYARMLTLLALPVGAIIGGASIWAGWSPPATAQTPAGLAASINASPTSTGTGQVVGFSFSITQPPDAASGISITSATIDFGDGQTSDGGSAGPNQDVTGTTAHVYSDPGTYTVTLSATASDGETPSVSTTVTIGAPTQPPTILLRPDSTSVQPGQTVSFSYQVTTDPNAGSPAIVSMIINFGDGASMPLSSPSGTVTHSYSAAGSYPVLISAMDANGQPGAASVLIQVSSS